MNETSAQFRMENYAQHPPFASFLPGIAGVKGIPIWCYYVNRGQGVVSFGVDNKDHAIMEFLPAHRAYAMAARTGFRTFLRRDGQFFEPFQDGDGVMTVESNALHLEQHHRPFGLRTQVDYFVLPEERLGALVRRVTVTNTGADSCRLELLDGMPELIPYGVNDRALKHILQTAKASMQVEDVQARVPYYRVRASMDDTAQVRVVEGGNFALGLDETGALLPAVADPEAVFAYDTALERPRVFLQGGLAGVQAKEQHSSNLLPCAFFAASRTLAPGQSLAVNEIIGQVENHALLEVFAARTLDGAWFDSKLSRARALTDELCGVIRTHTGDPVFDAYCKYTYMDNVLRGGQPMLLGDKVFHVYSRKHGDLERDYNYFSMLPEFYSQGNGNFRDVNQNRRCDPFFFPFTGRHNIRAFYSLIQLDGYNPLSVEMQTYTLSPQAAAELTGPLEDGLRQALAPILAAPFTPGRLYETLAGRMEAGAADGLFSRIMTAGQGQLNASFGEGYWSDHWTYNLDLVEEYLALFPEQEAQTLYTPEHTWFLAQIPVNPRARRYVLTEKGVRQYHALDASGRRDTREKYLRDAQGRPVYSCLAEKLTLLCAVKFATLDPYAMGVEMEGGKPGWYDALNGLPGLLGSSMAETYELARMLEYTVAALERCPGRVDLLEEIAGFLQTVCQINDAHRQELAGDGEVPGFWNDLNDAKEAYRAQVWQGVSGRRTAYDAARLASLLSGLAATVRRGVEKARRCGAAGLALCPTYFAYDVTEYDQDSQGIHPRHFALRLIPAFLEGPVRCMKLALPAGEKKALYEAVRASELYDRKLAMYRVNASLQDASYELGRCRAFTPGWLENASIWLHMEYKYLLELLRSGLYGEFFRDFHRAAVPFLDPETYGRSPLENSSFIASSANPNESIHGRGFVARLSGSTAEFLSIWRRMMFGERPFSLQDGRLVCRLEPAIPAYLIGEDLTVRARFMGSTDVTYRLADRLDHIPGGYRTEEIRVRFRDGSDDAVSGGTLEDRLARALRDGEIAAVTLTLKRL